MNVTTSPASSAFIVIASSFPAHLSILACEQFKISRDVSVDRILPSRVDRPRRRQRSRETQIKQNVSLRIIRPRAL